MDRDAPFSVKTYLTIECFKYLKIYRTNKVNMIWDLVSIFFRIPESVNWTI